MSTFRFHKDNSLQSFRSECCAPKFSRARTLFLGRTGDRRASGMHQNFSKLTLGVAGSGRLPPLGGLQAHTTGSYDIDVLAEIRRQGMAEPSFAGSGITCSLDQSEIDGVELKRCETLYYFSTYRIRVEHNHVGIVRPRTLIGNLCRCESFPNRSLYATRGDRPDCYPHGVSTCAYTQAPFIKGQQSE